MSDLISRQDVYNIIEDHDRKYSLHQEGGVDWYNDLLHDIEMLPSADRPQKVTAQVTFDEEKLREIVKEAVERFKEESGAYYGND